MRICILHRYPANEIKATNASFNHFVSRLFARGHSVDIKTFRKFSRFRNKWWKSLLWIFYAPLLVAGFEYDLIYCDDSLPFYAGLVKLVSPRSKVVKRMGDFHLMYYFSGFLYDLLHLFERWEWKKCDLLLPVSAAMWNQMVREGFHKVRVVKDPVDLTDFDIGEFDPRWDVMFHGYLNKNKGVEMVLEAAKRLSHLKFCIIGDGPAAAALEKAAPKNVEFIGWFPYKDIPFLLKATKIGLAIRNKNPGNEYVYTQPYLQYCAASRPVLVSDRKVFADYPWRFNSVDELVKLIRNFTRANFNWEGACKLCRDRAEAHDAKRIAEYLVDICCSTNLG